MPSTCMVSGMWQLQLPRWSAHCPLMGLVAPEDTVESASLQVSLAQCKTEINTYRAEGKYVGSNGFVPSLGNGPLGYKIPDF